MASDIQTLRTQLSLILAGIKEFGSAQNAGDRGYDDAVAELEQRGHDYIRSAFRNAPQLCEMLPRLWGQVARGENLADEGFEIRKEVEAALARLGAG
jgi:hypothetical protein